MLQIRIDGEIYKIVHEWCDLTIADAVTYYGIPQPEALKSLNKLLIKNTAEYTKAYGDLSQRDRMITLPEYYGKVIRLMSNIPDEVLDRLFWRVRTELFETHLHKFMIGLDFHPAYQARGIGFFWHGGVKYLIPDADRMTAVEWCEAADLEAMGVEVFTNQGEVMARMMAVLCRPEEERYDEQKIKERIEPFKSLPLDVVWEVYDFFLQWQSVLNGIVQGYSKREVSRAAKLLSRLDSVGSVGTVT